MELRHTPLRSLHARASHALQTGAFAEAARLLAEAPEDDNFAALRGILAQQTGDYTKALIIFNSLLAKQPANPGMMLNRAMVLGALKRHDEALAELQAVNAMVPSAAAHMVMAEIYKERDEKAKAVEAMGRAMALGARAPELAGNYWMARREICDWSQPMPALSPADLTPACATALYDDPLFLRQVAEYFCATRFPQQMPVPPRRATAGRRIRLGYISGDIHAHATAYLMAELFELHDRNRFEVFCFSYSADDGSAIRRRIVNSVEHFVDAHRRPLVDLVTTLKAAELDILVDLKGHTRNDALVAMSCRTAPIQIHYLGHAGTTGAPFIDYLVGDAVVTPPEFDGFYSEKIIRMPHSYQINDRARLVAPVLPRSAYGLPDDAVVLASFNQTFKITPAVFAAWMAVMRARPQTVLWLLGNVADARTNLQAEATKAGVDPARLHFAGFVPNEQHIARYGVVDIVLDTYPYGGHTTSSDALWMAAPVVTMMGRNYASRVAASLLTAVGLTELITTTPDDYKNKILSLIDAPAERARLRQHLNDVRATCPLFDTAGWVKGWEAALHKLVT